MCLQLSTDDSASRKQVIPNLIADLFLDRETEKIIYKHVSNE